MSGWSPSTGSPATASGSRCSWLKPGRESPPNSLTGTRSHCAVCTVASKSVPGAQAQVDWGDEGDLLAHVGIPTVYSFHMVLSHSRDPFCCFTTRMDPASVVQQSVEDGGGEDVVAEHALDEEHARELRARGPDMDWDQAVAYTSPKPSTTPNRDPAMSESTLSRPARSRPATPVRTDADHRPAPPRR
jgi:hypothetical protein